MITRGDMLLFENYKMRYIFRDIKYDTREMVYIIDRFIKNIPEDIKKKEYIIVNKKSSIKLNIKENEISLERFGKLLNEQLTSEINSSKEFSEHLINKDLALIFEHSGCMIILTYLLENIKDLEEEKFKYHLLTWYLETALHDNYDLNQISDSKYLKIYYLIKEKLILLSDNYLKEISNSFSENEDVSIIKNKFGVCTLNEINSYNGSVYNMFAEEVFRNIDHIDKNHLEVLALAVISINRRKPLFLSEKQYEVLRNFHQNLSSETELSDFYYVNNYDIKNSIERLYSPRKEDVFSDIKSAVEASEKIYLY